MSKFWDKQEEVGRVTKNKKEDVVISKCERQDKEYLDVRIYTTTKDSEEYIPTSKGFAIEKSMAKDISVLIDKAFK